MTAPIQPNTPSAVPSLHLASTPEILRHLRSKLRELPHARSAAFISIILLGIASWCGVRIPTYMGKMVDAVQSSADATAIWHLFAIMVLFALSSAILFALGLYLLAAKVSEALIANLRETMVTTALDLPLHQVEDAGTGDLVSRSTDDVAELSTAVNETLPVFALSSFTLIAATCAFAGLNPWFLLVVILVAPIAVHAGKRYVRRAPASYAAERASMGQRARSLLEAIHGYDTVRAYRMQHAMIDNVDAASWQVVLHGLRARMVMIQLNATMAIARTVAIVTALFIGYWQVQDHNMSTGEVTAALLLILQVFGPLMMLMRSLDTIQSGWASLARIVGVSAHTTPAPALEQPATQSATAARAGYVECDHATFGYDAEQPTVHDITFQVPPGHSVALVGATGAGKSTIAALIAGLRLPDQGHIRIDGQEVHTLSDEQRYGRIALISQEMHIFAGTLAEDLSLAQPTATETDMQEALALAGLTDWVRQLPDGLQTKVGAGGIHLEPVRIQQLALARIALFDPAILIMDEATAEAGSQHAAALEAAAHRLQQGRTVITVAHRLDQAAQADEILVLAQGRIIERGSHQTLLAAQGTYATMWHAWQAGKPSTPQSTPPDTQPSIN